jgi:hypothetical protein
MTNILFSLTLASLTTIQTSNLANTIYKIEGVHSHCPYGIKSIQTNGDKEKARQICIHTINNNFSRWSFSPLGKQTNFIDFLANKYCPPNVDKIGNERWKLNMRKELK